MRPVIVLSMLLLLGGCSGAEPRFDGSSRKSAEASMAMMTEGMNAEENKQFRTAVALLVMTNAVVGILGENLSGEPAANPYAVVDGLTVAEILAKSKASESQGAVNSDNP